MCIYIYRYIYLYLLYTYDVDFYSRTYLKPPRKNDTNTAAFHTTYNTTMACAYRQSKTITSFCLFFKPVY